MTCTDLVQAYPQCLLQPTRSYLGEGVYLTAVVLHDCLEPRQSLTLPVAACPASLTLYRRHTHSWLPAPSRTG